MGRLVRGVGMVVAVAAASVMWSACSRGEAGKSAAPAPQYGAWGFDAAGGDHKAKPGDDFFRYANGAWIDKTEIPADKPGFSLRRAASDLEESRLHDMMDHASAALTGPPIDINGQVGAFYKAFMDEKRVEQLGSAPIRPQLDAIRAATTVDKLEALMGRNVRDFNGSAFAITLDADLKDPAHYAVYVGQAGLGLPDRDYYLEPRFSAQKAKYQAYVATLLKAIAWPDADARASDIVDLETKIAEASWTRTQDRDIVASYNPMTMAELIKLAPGFNWRGFFAEANLDAVTRVVVAEKSAFPKIAAIVGGAPVPVLQAWQAFDVASNSAPYLSSAFVNADFDMRGKTLHGLQQQPVRWLRGVRFVSGGDYSGDRFDRFGNLGWAVGQMYTAKYFPADAKANIENLVTNIKAAYRERITHLDWMSDATKAEALKKLDTYAIKVGYPDHQRDYTDVVIKDDDLTGDVIRAATADWAFYVNRLNGPVDRGDWAMTPQTNDAYNGSLRDIVFPAGILTPPIFDPLADPAINYGAAGAVIGHELTHGFDDEGRTIDAIGALRDWWAPADAKTFTARASVLADQYSLFEPVPGAHINGKVTLGENIADLGGVTLALDAYRASLAGQPAPVLDGLTGDQRVFIGWAQAWRGQVSRRRREESARHRRPFARPLPRQRRRPQHRRVV